MSDLNGPSGGEGQGPNDGSSNLPENGEIVYDDEVGESTNRADARDYTDGDGLTFEVWQLHNSRTGTAGNVVIIDSDKYIYPYQDKTGDHWQRSYTPKNMDTFLEGWEQIQITYEAKTTSDFNLAKAIAWKTQVGGTWRARIEDGMPLAWISFTQVFYVLVLFSPGVIFVGSMYAALAQIAVVISACMSNAPYLMTATRVSTAVAVGNVLLSLLVWQSAYSTVDKISAAYRAALVMVIGFAMVCTNQFLSRVADSHRHSLLSAKQL